MHIVVRDVQVLDFGHFGGVEGQERRLEGERRTKNHKITRRPITIDQSTARRVAGTPGRTSARNHEGFPPRAAVRRNQRD